MSYVLQKKRLKTLFNFGFFGRGKLDIGTEDNGDRKNFYLHVLRMLVETRSVPAYEKIHN